MMEGVPVKVLHGEYTVPGVTLRLHFRHERALDVLARRVEVDGKEGNKLLVAFALDILRQNYPEITEDELIDKVSIPDLGAIIGAALPQSGYSQRPLGSPPASASPAPSSSAGLSTQPAGESTTSSTSPGPT